jgi:phosphatidylethanolamine-binding protein (PEBP) family uncharacterized protein
MSTSSKQLARQIARHRLQSNRKNLPPYKQHHLPNLFKTKRTAESTPQAFEKSNLSRPELELISTVQLFPTPTQIAEENTHPKYPLNEKEKKKPYLMKKRAAVYRNPQTVNNSDFNRIISKLNEKSHDPNGNLTLRDALLVNMLSDDVQSEVLYSMVKDENILYPKIGMPYDRVAAQSPETQVNTVDTLTVSFDILERQQLVNPSEHGDVLSVNLTGVWQPSLSKVETVELDESVRAKRHFELWEHALIQGNWVRPHIPQNGPPKILFPSDTNTLRSDKLYSVVLVTPDFPYRLYSEPGVFVHWWVSNLSGTSNSQDWNQIIESGKANTVIDYLAPLPCEYGGTGRYILMVFEQDKQLDNIDLKSFKEETLGEKYQNSARYMSHVKSISRFMHWYEKEALQHQINSKLELFDFDPSKFDVSEIKDSEYRLPQQQQCDQAVLDSYNSRRQFSLNKMFDGKLPHGLCYSKMEYEYSVTEYLQDKGMAALEKEYVPPDVVWERVVSKDKLNKRQERYLNYQQWK